MGDIKCIDCEEEGTIEESGDKLKCNECGCEFPEVIECQFCGQKYACDSLKKLEGSYLSGCRDCPGRDLNKD